MFAGCWGLTCWGAGCDRTSPQPGPSGCGSPKPQPVPPPRASLFSLLRDRMQTWQAAGSGTELLSPSDIFLMENNVRLEGAELQAARLPGCSRCYLAGRAAPPAPAALQILLGSTGSRLCAQPSPALNEQLFPGPSAQPRPGSAPRQGQRCSLGTWVNAAPWGHGQAWGCALQGIMSDAQTYTPCPYLARSPREQAPPPHLHPRREPPGPQAPS